MSTQAEIQDILRPYVEQHPDLVLTGRAVILRPVRHLMCGYYLDRTSAPALVRLFWFAGMTYVPQRSRGFQWAGEPVPRQSNILAADFQECLYATMEAGFTELRKHQDALTGFGINLRMYWDLPPSAEVEGLRCVAEGDLAGADRYLSLHVAGEKRGLEERLAFARRHCRAGSRAWKREMEIYETIKATLERTTKLLDLVRAGDRPAVANLLREWEARQVEAWKVEKHWISSPFPLETDGSPAV
jgi:hypothetical protein